MSYKIGNRQQPTFLPNTIDEYITEKDPVRVYDAFVEALKFDELGIPIEAYKAGADEYYPKDMLKLMIYGYSYGDRSSRKLERACHHNLSYKWLMRGLTPQYRTIARFRNKYKEQIKKVLKQCVRLCIELELIDGNTIFIDGSGIRANASIKNSWTKKRCRKHLKKIDKKIDEIIEESQKIDEKEQDQTSLVETKENLKDQEQRKQMIQDTLEKLQKKEEQSPQSKTVSYNTIDEESIKMKTRQGAHACHNAQVTTDAKHGLIIHSETTDKSDSHQFKEQLEQSIEVLGKKPKAACSDAGYYSVKNLDGIDEDIQVIIPSQRQSQLEKNADALKPFDKEQFEYDKTKDQYICPEGKELKRVSGPNCQKTIYQANAEDCQTCRHFKDCTTNKRGRQIIELSEEEKKVKERLEQSYHSPNGQEIYKLRKQKAEIPFGHIKQNLGAGQFLLRGRSGSNAELSILSTCFNIARMITIIGIPGLLSRLNGT